MTTYYYNMTDIDTSATKVSQVIVVGDRTLTFQFQWAVASAEQGSLVASYLINRAASDPLLNADGNYNRTYDWYEYYAALFSIDLDEWLDSNPILPVSVINANNRAQQKTVLNRNITEARTLTPIVQLYTETMRWQFQASTADLDTITGIVEPGGWFRNQDAHYAFRFHSARDYIGQGDLNELAIEFEVYDE